MPILLFCFVILNVFFFALGITEVAGGDPGGWMKIILNGLAAAYCAHVLNRLGR